MLVDDVVELVFPPLPPPPKLSARTAVPGTRSNGSLAPAAVTAKTKTSANSAATTPPRFRMNRYIENPFRLTGQARAVALGRRGQLAGGDASPPLEDAPVKSVGPPFRRSLNGRE